MAIRDRDVRNALETLETEVENFEAQIKEKDEEILELTQKVDGLESQVEEYESRITELEEALAEAYLTSEKNDGTQRENDKLSTGCGTNVPDPKCDSPDNG